MVCKISFLLNKSLLLISFFILCRSFSLFAQTTVNAPNPDTAHLKVGVAGSSPFIIEKNNKEFNGIAYDIWQMIAVDARWNYSVVDYSSVAQALDSLENGKIDILVGPISITSERVNKVRFSQPYYQSSLSIMSRAEKRGLWDRISPFFSWKLAVALAVFLFILAIVGTLIWIAERKESPEQFPPDPPRGIANGMWLAIVTMSTTGYGDKAPVTLLGRIITGCWMVISIIFATSMVAGIASTLTLTGMGTSTITKASELAGKQVATIKNSPAIDFIDDNNATPVQVDNLDSAYQLLKDKKVAAVVYDRPQLQYYLKTHPDDEIQVGVAQYYKQGYGFAFPKGNNKLLPEVNIHLLNLMEENRVQPVVDRWLGKEDE